MEAAPEGGRAAFTPGFTLWHPVGIVICLMLAIATMAFSRLREIQRPDCARCVERAAAISALETERKQLVDALAETTTP